MKETVVTGNGISWNSISGDLSRFNGGTVDVKLTNGSLSMTEDVDSTPTTDGTVLPHWSHRKRSRRGNTTRNQHSMPPPAKEPSLDDQNSARDGSATIQIVVENVKQMRSSLQTLQFHGSPKNTCLYQQQEQQQYRNNVEASHVTSVYKETCSDAKNVSTSGLSSGNFGCKDFRSVKWPRIILFLTRKEKEHDFLVLKGNKLPQRPKKRPKIVERSLIYCTPGYWLTDISHGRYDVREKKHTKKSLGGLKGMGGLDSDSE